MSRYFLNKKIFFFLLILIIFYRSPYILLEGRFLAEEGSIWYRNVFLNGPIDSLIFISNFSGYFHLWMNISSSFSWFVPIEYAPLVTVYFAFFLLLYIFIYILNSESALFPNNASKYVGCMIVLFSPVMTAEVWLNSLNAMSYFGVLGFLIIFENNQVSRFKKINPFVVGISGLSGLYACILAPIYYVKYYKTKNKIDLINFFIISTCATFQFIIIAYSKLSNEIASERFFITNEKFINFIYNAILKPFFGREFLQNGLSLVNFELLLVFSYVCLLILFFFILKTIIVKKDYILTIIFLSFLAVSFLVIFGSAYKNFAGGRYAVVPGVIISFVLMRLFYLYKENLIKYFFGFIFSFSLLAGLVEFKYYALYPDMLACINCPNWKEEVLKWKNDNKYKLKIWVYPKQSMMLY